ncbi:MAG: hypothetical protein WC641_06565 [Patescibacteria group bacterium]
MSKGIVILITALVVAGAAVGTVAIVRSMPEKPLMFRFIEDKLNSIITPKPPLGDLTPVRDLRGTWKSSLAGKGVQVYGKFVTGPSATTIYEDGDMELIIDSVTNNLASGKFRYTNLCVTGQTAAPKPVGTFTIPKQCTKDTGYYPITIRVSGSALDFGTVTVSGATVTMQGSYTTDIMTGSMTATLPAYGVLKGEFHLNRK